MAQSELSPISMKPNQWMTCPALTWPRCPTHTRLRSSYEDSFFGKTFRYGNFFTPSQDNLWALRYGLTWKPTVHDLMSRASSRILAPFASISR